MTGKSFEILLVKPHPPKEILESRTAISEQNRYHWEPLVLKMIAFQLQQHFGSIVKTEIWHLINYADDDALLKRIHQNPPAAVAFTEIDVLVNEVNKLAYQIKKIAPQIITIVGGKQSSLLLTGDDIPFNNIDYIISGPANPALSELLEAIMDDRTPDSSGLIKAEGGKVVKKNRESSPIGALPAEPLDISCLEVFNHQREEYYNSLQFFPGSHSGKYSTAALLMGIGCGYQCSFCQNSVENNQYKKQLPVLIEASAIAREMAHLHNKYKVNRFFSLLPNMDFEQIQAVYSSLELLGIEHLQLSGFVRVKDVINAREMLPSLVSRGMNCLSIGLDIPGPEAQDVYRKGYTHSDIDECLRLCADLGIAVLATVVGDPGLTRDEFASQLERLKSIAVAQIDVRLAIALRNTNFFNEVKEYLIETPDSPGYYDKQNYRYQTIQYPGKITPAETYNLVNAFKKQFSSSSAHESYKKQLVRKNPETALVF